MSPVVYVVVGALMAAFALLVLAGILRSRTQSAAQAQKRLRANLGRGVQRAGVAEINPIIAYPFSEEMIREAARLDGYEFVDEFNRNGSRLLRFRAAGSKRGRHA